MVDGVESLTPPNASADLTLDRRSFLAYVGVGLLAGGLTSLDKSTSDLLVGDFDISMIQEHPEFPARYRTIGEVAGRHIDIAAVSRGGSRETSTDHTSLTGSFDGKKIGVKVAGSEEGSYLAKGKYGQDDVDLEWRWSGPTGIRLYSFQGNVGDEVIFAQYQINDATNQRVYGEAGSRKFDFDLGASDTEGGLDNLQSGPDSSFAFKGSSCGHPLEVNLRPGSSTSIGFSSHGLYASGRIAGTPQLLTAAFGLWTAGMSLSGIN